MGSNALTPKGSGSIRGSFTYRGLVQGGGLRGREWGPCTSTLKEEGLADPKSALIEISTLR